LNGYIDAMQADLPEVISGNICIVGAGAAGITLARKLAETVSGVILIESGGFDISGQTQSLFQGRHLGLKYFDLMSCRLRYFGGTTNHWSGFCRENDQIDYVGRPALGLPAWPITRQDLSSYIVEAGRSLGIEPSAFNPDIVLKSLGENPEQLVEHGSSSLHLQTKVFQLAQDIRLGTKYREQVGQSPNITAYLNLNLIHIQLAADARSVKHLKCATLTGKQCRVEARQYVLCCHGIENARQLLASNDVMPTGVGNSYDHVGRYFMEHAAISASKFIPTSKFPKIYNFHYARSKKINANLSFTDDYLHKHNLLQYYCRFTPHYVTDEMLSAKDDVIHGFWKPGSLAYLADVAKVASEFDGELRRVFFKRGLYSQPLYYSLEHRIEQAPNPKSRVVLSDRIDALGQRIADLDWQINEHDVATIKHGQTAIAREMAALGFGRLEEEEITRELVESRIKGHYHHIGTTRMSADPKQGVVDKNCTVHGIGNLHISGSSVFPTAGYSGPTMMIIALALRQAEYLKTRLI